MSNKKKQPADIWPINTAMMDELVLCTVRYYLGRGSIAALSFPQDELPKLLVMCSASRQETILDNIREYVQRVDKGFEREVFKGDANYWRSFLESHK